MSQKVIFRAHAHARYRKDIYQYLFYFFLFREREKPHSMRFPAVLLGVLVRFIGRKIAIYWEFWCDLLGVLVRVPLWITFLLGVLVRYVRGTHTGGDVSGRSCAGKGERPGSCTGGTISRALFSVMVKQVDFKERRIHEKTGLSMDNLIIC